MYLSVYRRHVLDSWLEYHRRLPWWFVEFHLFRDADCGLVTWQVTLLKWRLSVVFNPPSSGMGQGSEPWLVWFGKQG